MHAKQGIYIFTLMGLLLSLLLDCMMRYEVKTAFYYMLPTLFSLFYALSYNEKHSIRLIKSSLIAAVFFSFPLLTFYFTLQPNKTHTVAFLVAFPMFAYVGHAFHYAYHHDNCWRVNYKNLFAAVWNTIPLLILAGLFTGLAQALLYLAAYMFKTVGNTFLWSLLFENYHGRLISSVTLFFAGLAIGKQNISIIHSLRFLLLRIMYYLFPVLALISIVYFVLCLSHFITHHTALTDLEMLMPLNILGIIFFNAYFQDGSVDSDAPAWLKYTFKIYRVVLLIQMLTMTWHIFRSFSFDSNVLIYLLVAIFYALTYAITACMPKQHETQWIQRGNISTALFFILSLFLFNLPYIPIIMEVGLNMNP
jgi:hypothetical protein